MRYTAKAIGSGSEGAMQELEDKVNKVRSAVSWAPLTAQSLSLEAAKLLTLRVLKQVRYSGKHEAAASRSIEAGSATSSSLASC